MSHPTPRLVFPDTTVLINFGLIDEMALLGRLVEGKAAWCATVAGECDDQADKWQLPQMRSAHAIFGEPLRLATGAEFAEFRSHQQFFRQASSNPAATHAGESEMLAILGTRCITSVVITDDGAVAVRVASLGMGSTIQVATSWQLLRIALWNGHLTRARIWEIRRILLGRGRAAPPEVRDATTFATWIEPPGAA